MPEKHALVPLKMLLFCFHGANTMVVSFLPLLLTYRGLTGQEIGWVLAIGPAVSIFSQPFWGFMSDKYQTVQKVLITTSIGLVISSAVFFQMRTLTLIFALAVAFYFFSSAIGPLADSLSQRRAAALGVSFGAIRTWGSIGFALSSLLVGELLGWFGIQYLVIPYVIMASLVLIVSLRLTDMKVETKPVQLSDIKVLLKDKRLLAYLAVLLLVTITHRTNDNFIGLFISSLGGRDNLVGWAWFMGVASEAAVFMFAGKWYQKYHPLIFMAFAGMLYGLRWLSYGFVSDPLIIVLLQVLHGVCFGVFYLAAFQYVTRLIPKQLQATGHLMFMTFFFGISGIIGALGGGYLLEQFGGSVLYLTMGVMALVGALLIVVYHTWMQRR
ncbi:MFS transporter, PPP family, 3-phenylpropionic acid transporter [Amphibacillus marinus]|uniref:MFS transporter, PPP family, 3-phenylpropionic acid transporter n=1 Tax=Amphibacillus marinus TaxID=872970 RepID=A0A1H8MGF5_9BACI|nr:MFS transporter [Amphibacillus marinus]SEO16236.1 MFS transporter, PPP family, 3-phenylpropionic acid transporter [Amphibacillus marinus]